jgi:hypothetical protein
MSHLFSIQSRLILYLLIFNVADWYFTWYGIEKQYVEEANPLLTGIIIENPVTLLIWKVLAPLVLYFLLPYCRSRWIYHILLFTICLYITVNIYHLIFFLLHSL